MESTFAYFDEHELLKRLVPLEQRDVPRRHRGAQVLEAIVGIASDAHTRAAPQVGHLRSGL